MALGQKVPSQRVPGKQGLTVPSLCPLSPSTEAPRAPWLLARAHAAFLGNKALLKRAQGPQFPRHHLCPGQAAVLSARLAV